MCRLRHHINAFREATEGTILVFWAMCLVVFFGIVAMSFDMGRIGITQSELQSFADHVALAAAGELDGRPDSITRANAAAAAFVTDRQTFGSGGQELQGDTDYTLSYYETLPANDVGAGSAFGAALDPNDPDDARKAAFVRAVTFDSTVDLTFGAVFAALSDNDGPENTVSATAVAGFTEYACDVTPMMVCLPGEDWLAEENVGQAVHLRAGGNGAQWGPGNFGFLRVGEEVKIDPKGPCAGLKSAQLERCMFGAVNNIAQCFVTDNGVDTDPGQSVGIEDAAFNVRFDMFSANMKKFRNDPDYAPAPSVIDGIVTENCKADLNVDGDGNPLSVALPPDDCFGDGTCDRFGDTIWTEGRAEYEAVNYGGTPPAATADAKTRYEYYLAELGSEYSSTTALLSDNPETGRPQCAAAAVPNPDRRVIVVAGVNCEKNEIKGSAENVPVQEFVKIFLIQPGKVSGSKKFDMFGEIIGPAGSDGGGGTQASFHDVIQLYR